MKLKVCGMKYQENIAAVAALQPDYLGFIFYEKSARFVQSTTPTVSKSIKKTGVFVNASLAYIVDQIKTHNLQAVQLHGHETPEYCKELKLSCDSALDAKSSTKNDEILNHVEDVRNIEIIKVFSIKNTIDFNVLAAYESVCDYYLFDTKGELPGGNGVVFNWNVLQEYPSTKPYFLSGGIGLDKLENIEKFKNSEVSKYCYAIDVNSKFEVEAGLKDIEKLKEFKSQL